MENVIREQYSNITSLIIMQDNEVLYENYFNDFTKKDALHIASVSKSIVSILIGIAIDKGFIKSVDEKVLSFFPAYVLKRGEKTLQKITLRHLLTMTAPYKYKSEPYTKVYSSENWTQSALDLLGGKGHIGDFKYSTVGSQVLSGILVNATGQSLLQFAKEVLFDPLGIESPCNKMIESKEDYISFLKEKSVGEWVHDATGVNTAGWGLALKAMDLAKIGQLCLNNGYWNGTHIVSSKWIEESTREHSHWNSLSYAYLWWIINDEELSGYAALGDGGNVIFVSPKNNFTLIIASSFKPRAKDRISFIKDYILPLFEMNTV